jgi:hypothetical protein
MGEYFGLAHVMSICVRIGQDSSGYDRFGQVISGYVRLRQFMSRYLMIVLFRSGQFSYFQVSSFCQDISVYIRLVQVVRLCQVRQIRSGYLWKDQVRTGYEC